VKGAAPRLCSAAVAATVAAAVGALAAAGAAARPAVVRAEVAPSHAIPTAHAAAPRAPSGPPLTHPGAQSEAASGEEVSAPSAQGELDPLVGNGLASPLCGRAVLGSLSASNRRHCEISGFVAAGAPTGDYGIDVDIDAGVLGFGEGTLLSAVQALFVTPVWMALVWAVHALVVMLEWCFTIDLPAGANLGGIGQSLRRMQSTFTGPWLALALCVASVLALYHGLIRRRVAETAGQVALMVAMMVAGLWVILDPAGTVGALGQWADQAAIGTLATAAQGSPAQPERALAAGLDMVFTTAVEAPWCYLEFGDVEWCRRPARLDPGLRRAGLSIAAQEQALIGCRPSTSPLLPCAAAGSAAAAALRRSAELLRSAQSNGAIFLALPPNGAARNSIDGEGSLLQAICRGSSLTSCRGPSAVQAEFRSSGATWSRVGGLVLIAAGLLGMLLLLGFLALRLLAAAIFSLLYLLLAPMMVLAPAFGDGGRAAFRRWSSQLLGMLVAKLLYAFLLGAVLAVLAVVSGLSAIGWWTQWLLLSALWWGAFVRRHQVLGFGDRAGRERRAGLLARRMHNLLPTRGSVAAARWAKRMLGRETSTAPELARGALAPGARPPRPRPRIRTRQRTGSAWERGPRSAEDAPRGGMDSPGRGDPHSEGSSPRGDGASAGDGSHPLGGGASARGGRHPHVAAPITYTPAEVGLLRIGKRHQIERLTLEHGKALAARDAKRSAKLAWRAERVTRELERIDAALGVRRPGSGRKGKARETAEQRRIARAAVDRELARQREEHAQRSSSREAPREPIPRRDVESSVMRDLREVAAGRKRQLGIGRP
jgi:hypothetical protein